METSANLIKKFNDKYKVKMFSIEDALTQARKMKYLDDFLFEKKESKLERNMYVDGLSKLMKQFVTNNTKFNAKGEYGISNFSIQDFVNEYEEIMSTYAQENGKTNRKPFENLQYASLLKYVMKDIKPLNQSVEKFWANDILKGDMKMTDMEAITDAANRALNAACPNKFAMENILKLNAVKDLSSVKEEDRQKYLDAQKKYAAVEKNLTNLVLAKNAMKQVHAKRSGWWKFWHRTQNKQEKAFIAKLENQQNILAAKGFPISEVLLQHYKPVLKTPLEECEKFVEAEQNKVAAPKQEKEVEKPVQFTVNEADNSKTLDVQESKPVQPAPAKTVTTTTQK